MKVYQDGTMEGNPEELVAYQHQHVAQTLADLRTTGGDALVRMVYQDRSKGTMASSVVVGGNVQLSPQLFLALLEADRWRETL